VLVTIPLGWFILNKYRKAHILLAFLVGYLPLVWVMQGTKVFSLALEGTLIFFVTVMMTEPNTTPSQVKQQWIFGVLIGLLLAATQRWGFLPLPFTMSLLIGNLVYVWMRRRMLFNSV